MSTYLERRRTRAAHAWNLSDDVVLVGAGGPIGIPGGADQTYPYLAHADYHWLTDREVPNAVVAFDPKDGWVEFVPDITQAERVWEGKTEVAGTPLSRLEGWLAERRGRPVANLGCAVPGVAANGARATELTAALMHARRPKDDVELERMRAAAAASAVGYEMARGMIRAGVTERQVAVELETGFFRGGGTRTAYETIVASGANSAVLHFPPTSRPIREGDAVLIDAGAAVGRYASDVTRTYRAPGGGDDGFFRELYALVLAVEERAIARCVAGAEWRDAHLESAVGIAAGLVAMGLMKGEPTSLVESDAHAVFFPHGLGHLVGLGVRDASGRAPGREPSKRPGLANLRLDLPLDVDYTITVEPGVYFIPALVHDPELRRKHADAIRWDKVEPLLAFGGIRIEDDCVVGKTAPEVLTRAIPK